MALAEIVANKHQEVRARKARRPLETLRSDLVRSDRSLAQRLAHPRTGYIMECKRASPSRGLIRKDFNPGAIARSYAPYCDGISVLTDTNYFQGSFDYLRQVREQAPVPVLCKDFVVDCYQIDEARWHGADAILLMCSVLNQEELLRCLARCEALGMDALVEVHDEQELDRALASPARIIGINNRNLKTLQVDLSTSEALAGRVNDPTRLLVCESGIGSHQDVLRLRPLCSAFLVGTAFMQAPNIDRAIRELVFGRVKVCGLRHPADAVAAWQAGACYGGFIDFSPSARHLAAEQQKSLMAAAPLQWAQVVVDHDLAELVEDLHRNDADIVQLHGNEDAKYVQELRRQLASRRRPVAIWKAKRVGKSDAATDGLATADRLLLDSYRPGMPGGTGKTFDWEIAQKHPARRELVLSGGLQPSNAEAAQQLGCWALDLSSGVESAPGVKDHGQIHAFFEQLRGQGKASAAASRDRI